MFFIRQLAPKFQGMIAMLVAIFLYSISDGLLKWMAASYDPMQIVFCRSIFLILPLLYFLFFRAGIKRTLSTGKPIYHTLRAMIAAITVPLYIYAFKLLPLADVYAVAYVAPLFMALFSIPILGEKVERHAWIAILVGFFGVLVMMRPGSAVFSWGGVFALAAGILYGLSLVMSRKLSQTESTLSLTMWFTCACLIMSGFFIPFVWEPPLFQDWILFALIGFIGSVAQTLLTTAFKLAPAATVAPLEYLILVLGAIIGYGVWGDIPDHFVIIGSMILVGSGLYLLYVETRARRFVFLEG